MTKDAGMIRDPEEPFAGPGARAQARAHPPRLDRHARFVDENQIGTTAAWSRCWCPDSEGLEAMVVENDAKIRIRRIEGNLASYMTMKNS
ncbi:hypothetical protein ACFL6C_13545 [Myxococcota bacterium]